MLVKESTVTFNFRRMKRSIIGVVLLVSTVTSFAQNKNITVSGTVIEEETKEAAIQATVQLLSLPDSTYVTGAATLIGGKFTLPKVSAGKYILKISYIGFQTKLLPLQLASNKLNNDLGTIPLTSDAILLQEAVITAEAPPVTVKEDTVVYAASAYRVAEGAMLEELVKKLPGAEISEDGKITVNGKEIKKIMVDGKEFFSDDPNVSMKNLPANMVENVKSYERKSDMTRITGIDDGEEETVLDLTVKKGMKQGWIGNVIAGYGSEDRYEGGVMVSRFKDDASLSIIGSANNTNGTGFSEFGDAGQGMSGRGGGSGVTTSQSLGMNFAKDSEKFQIGGNVQYGHTDNDAQRKYSYVEQIGTNPYGEGNDNSRRNRHDIRGDFRLEWRLDTMTTIIFRPNISYSRTETEGNSWSNQFTDKSKTTQVNANEDNSFSKSDNLSLNGRLQVFRKLNSKGRNIFLGGNFGYSDGNTESDSYTETNFYEGGVIDSTDLSDRHKSIISDNRNWSVSASYTEPVFKNHFLQLRYEFSHRKRINESLVYDKTLIDYLKQPDMYVDSLSSRVENFYDTHTIEASIRGVYPKLMYNAGLGLIPQSSLSETTIGPNASNELPKQKVLNFAPQIMLRYSFNKQHTLMFRYRGQSSAPNIEYLQEVIDITNPLNLRYGNPNLNPSFNHNGMLFYNRYIPESMLSYNFNLFFSATQNAITDKMTYDPQSGVRTYRKVNVNGNWNTRGNFSINMPLKNRKFTISSNTDLRFSDAVSYASVDKEADAALNTMHSFMLGERLRGSYRSDMFDISLNGSINYNLARNDKQKNSDRETFDYYFGGETNITFPKQFYLSTDINYRIANGYGEGFEKNEVIWNAQISKNFLKNNSATIRFKIYDILQQQTNLSRSISNIRITDSQYNTLGSYFMVHFVYRFNTLGGKAPGRRQGFGPGGPGGRGPGGPPPGGGGGRRPF